MAEILEYKCPCCGGAIIFDSVSQQMKCPFCNTGFDVETLKAYDAELRDEQEQATRMNWSNQAGQPWNSEEAEGVSVYTCESCGGEIIADANTAATHCPFCDNPVIMTGRLSGALRPDYVIPFKLDKAAAKKAFLQHLKGKRLLPKIFKDQNHIDEIKGIYVPFWLFGCDVNANMHYRTTKLRSWSNRDYVYTETSHFLAKRAGTISFDRVPVDGSSKMPDDLMESIEPYNFSEAVDFQTAYLSGYFADKYDVTETESVQRANERIRRSTEEAFSATVQGFHRVSPQGGSIQLVSGQTNYALYPVWILNTTWNNQRYIFAMNGQTGKFVGNLPVDRKAYWRWFVILAVIFAALSYGLIWLFL